MQDFGNKHPKVKAMKGKVDKHKQHPKTFQWTQAQFFTEELHITRN
jgi:hypothetical protein